MKVTLSLERNLRIKGTDSLEHETFFDTAPEFGGENSAPTPMAIMLQAMGSCSYLDVISILKKKRKQIDSFIMELEGARANTHPKVFTDVHIKYILHSPDTEMKDLERAIELSQTTYCGASAMFQRSGCKVTTEAILAN
jgi:putative redox protein